MASSPLRATRLSAPVILVGIVITLALLLLIGRRLDARFAGGEGAGAHAQALLQETLPTNTALPPTLTRGETVTTDASTFATYTLNDTCTVSLAENTSLTLQDGRQNRNTFTFLTGRIVASGTCVFTTRETDVHISGTATLVHFSWLDELVIKALEGTTTVSQSGTPTTLTPNTEAERFFTLPSVSNHEPSALSLTENASVASFYSWSLTE